MTVAFGPSVQEVPLARAPLVSVIAQVRFPAVMKIEADSGFVATFQESIRKDYPILRPERQLGVMIGPGGVQPQDAGTVWRFETRDPDAWQVTLAPTFVSLSARRYTRRSDLLARLTVVLHALEAWLHPNVCDRVGVRYVDRVTGDQLARLSGLVRPEILGVAGDEAALGSVEIVHALSDTLFRLDDDSSRLRGRWGRVPAGATYDPGIEPSREVSWVLDLDHYTSQPEDFDLAAISGKVADFCDRIYTFFRWAVTDAFLDEFGAVR
ncbi:MAG: TIGR04255 family protein [Streptosporangiaceae bacterium]